MKKLFTITITVVLMALTLVGCSKPEAEDTTTTTVAEPVIEAVEATEETQHTRYVAHGRYYQNSDMEWELITDDGNIWSYDQETISDKPRYNAEPVYAGMDDNGTPDDIYDDIVLGLVFDVNTAIYDALETALSEEFELERDGNYIRVNEMKEDK